MNVYIALSLCFIPLFLCAALFNFFSKIKFSTELVAMLAALVALLPATFVQFLLVYFFPKLAEPSTQLLPLFLKTVFMNGIVEEGIKLVFLVFIPRKKTQFSHYFMAAILFGLAFGCFESAVYFLKHLQSAASSGATLIYHLIFIRMFSAVLVHTFCAGLLGIFIWTCMEKRPDILSLVFPVLMHGLYDFFVGFPTWIQWFAVAAILVAVLECRIRYEKNRPPEAYKKSPLPSKDSKDVTIETALKDAPAYDK